MAWCCFSCDDAIVDRSGRWASIQLIGDALPGHEKYLGGAAAAGKIYCVPGHAKRILEIGVDSSLKLRAEVFDGKYKWLRSAQLEDAIYMIPCHAERVLRIRDDTAELIGPRFTGQWKWHGGVVGSDGAIYCIPQSADRVLRITSDSVALVGPIFKGKWKWYGGLRTGHRIYGIPSCWDSVLAIDTSGPTPRISTIGQLGTGGWKWHGGVVAADGSVWGVPANADQVLKVHEDRVTLLGRGVFRSGRHRNDDKYKFLGACLGNDNKVYCVPSDADFVLQIDPATDRVSNFGPSLAFLNQTQSRGQNKWQNAHLLPDGAIYCVPLKAEHVLRIDTDRATIQLLPHPAHGKNLWEGAVLGPDGALYCMPLNCPHVLKISVKHGPPAS